VDPVTIQSTFTQLVNSISQQGAQEVLGLDLVAGPGITITTPNGQTTVISLYVPLTGNLFVSPSSAELGQVITTVNLNWSYNKPITSQSLNNGIGTLPITATSFVQNPILINSNITYRLTASDGVITITPTAVITYFHRVYWGVSLNDMLLPAEIQTGSSTLSNSRATNITYNCTGGYRFWYAYPVVFGLANAYVNGFPFSGWIGPSTSPQIVSITNTYGYTENYYYYLVNNVQNGAAIPVVWS
jgi:hypothetical protein